MPGRRRHAIAPLRIYNTLTARKEVFSPLEDGRVRMYTCGPTVYDFAHIGNFRAYVSQDLLRRYLRYKGYAVTHVMNITDVDDKTIRNARAAGMSLAAYTEKYTRFFFEDLDSLNCLKADVYPRATGHIDDMVRMIGVLLDKGYAYTAEDGSVYFAVSRFKEYGKLAKLDTAGLKAGARVKNDEYAKDAVSDFALWKAWDEDDGDVYWETPLGKGRPGWHIECSAMSTRYLGNPFDIHCGGVDLVFPHHENEIAQTEAATGRPFAVYWVHNEHLLVENRKMSKSAGNFYTLRQLLDKGISPAAIRYALLAVHYRQRLNFTFEAVEAAERAVERLHNFLADIERGSPSEDAPPVDDLADRAAAAFEDALDNDLNISEALAAVFNFVREVNRRKLSTASRARARAFVEKVDSVLGILGVSSRGRGKPAGITVAEIESLVEKRARARREKNFAEADAIRDRLARHGIVLEDGPGGTTWKTR